MTTLRGSGDKAWPGVRGRYRRKFGWALLAACLLLGTASLYAATWSDLAGHRFEADFVELKNGVVVFERAGGRTLRLKLSSLAQEDRIRVRKLSGHYDPVPPDMRRYCDLLQKRVQRMRLLYKHGKISAAELRDRKRKLRKSLVRRMKDEYPEDKIAEVAFDLFGAMQRREKANRRSGL